MLARIAKCEGCHALFFTCRLETHIVFYYFLVCMHVHAYLYTILFEMFLDVYIYILIYIYISIYYIYLFFFWVLCSFFLWPYLPKRSACEFSILHQKDMARDAHCKLMMVPLMLALP